jgi:ribosomal protein S27AE
MPRKQNINLDKVMAALNTVCPKCGCTITPDRIRRIDFERMVCPECGEGFTPEKRGEVSQ